MSICQKHIPQFILALMLFSFHGCEFRTNNPDRYFAKSREGLQELKNTLLEKKNVRTVYRREHLSPVYKIFGWQMIDYRIDANDLVMHVSFEVKHNFEHESFELRKKISQNDVTSVILYYNNEKLKSKEITLDSALSSLQLSKDEVISVFEEMKECKIVAIFRLSENPISLAFLINDRYYIIYTTDIRSITLERNKCPEMIAESWYYYDGVL